MACFGTCLDYARAIDEGKKLGMTQEQIDDKYDKEWGYFIKKNHKENKKSEIYTGMIL